MKIIIPPDTGTIDELLPIIHQIQEIDNNPFDYLKEHTDILFEIDILNSVELKIDRVRIYGRSAFGPNQLQSAIRGGCEAFIEWYNINKK
jgi:hypothetical protein